MNDTVKSGKKIAGYLGRAKAEIDVRLIVEV